MRKERFTAIGSAKNKTASTRAGGLRLKQFLNLEQLTKIDQLSFA
jgi:hypothetical protein